MVESKLLLTTPTDPRQVLSFFNEKTEIIQQITIISIDFPPLILQPKTHNAKNDSIFGKKEDQSALYDVAGIILEIMAVNDYAAGPEVNADGSKRFTKKVFLLAKDVVFMSNETKKMVSINGQFDLLPETLITKVYKNFYELKSANLEELEELLSISKDEVAIKAFRKLGTYFTPRNYEINNNIFNLIEHQDRALAVAKKVLLKKMVAWEIRD